MALFDMPTVESWTERCVRIEREWKRLSKLAHRWCEEGLGHQMGPLHQTSPYAKLADRRKMRCKRCRFHVFVSLSGELGGAERTCAEICESSRRWGSR